MEKKIRILLVLFFFSFLFNSCFYSKRSNLTFSTKGLVTDPRLIHGTLSNGFSYILYENLKPEGRVNISLDVFAGSINENDNQRGLAHFLEHMLFNGSTHFKPGELIEYFQSIGMDFGADANAHTGFFNTVYDLSLPNADIKSINDAFLVIEDYAQGALLLEDEINRERGIVLAEKLSRDSVSYRTFISSLQFELPGSILNNRHPIGIEKVLKTADQKLFKNFYDTWYRPDNMVLVAVGDFNSKELEKIIRQRFSSLEPRKKMLLSDPDITWNPHSGIKSFFHYEPEQGSCDITIETISKVKYKPESLDDLKKQVRKRLADSIVRNRLLKMIRSDNTPFSEAGIYSGTYLRHISIASISATCMPLKWEESLDIINTSLRQAIDFGFSENELSRVKKDYINGLESAVLKTSSRKSKNIANAIIKTINKKKIFLSPTQKRNLLVPYIDSLSLEEINKEFKQTWSDDHRLVVLTGNADFNIKNHHDKEEFILKLYHQSNKKSITKYEIAKQKKFPYLKEAKTKGTIIKSKFIKDLKIEQIDFDNLLRLNLKQTEFKKNNFRFKVVFGQGKKAEPEDLPGLSFLSQQVINQSGFASLDIDQLEDSLSGRDIDYKFSVSEDYFTISGNAGKEEIELVFQILQAFFMDTGFKEKALSLAKRRFEQMYKDIEKTPNGMMQIKGEKFFSSNDTRFGLPSPQVINKINLNDIKAWLKPAFKNSFLEISLVGDFDTQKAKDLAARYLYTQNKRKNSHQSTENNRNPKFPKGKKLIVDIDTKIEKSIVRISFLTDSFWDITQTRGLSMLSRVFSERLRKVIREKLGATYSPYVYNDPSTAYENYGVLHSVVNVEPSMIDPVIQEIEKIIKSLEKNIISKKELEQVKLPVMNHLKDLRKENGYWLNSVLAGSYEHPEKLDWARNIIDGYLSINTDDLFVLSKQFLRFDESAILVIKPSLK